MKSSAVVLIVFIGVVLATPPAPRGLNEQLKDALENLKKQMPCGFPEFDVPPLAPLKMTYQELQHESTLFSFLGSFFDLVVKGLDSFKVMDIKLSALTLKASYDINFNEISAEGEHSLHLFVFNLFKLSGAGDLDFKIRDLRLKGNMTLGAKDNGMYMKEFNIVVSLGYVKSNITGLVGKGLSEKLANRAIEDFVMFLIKYQSDLVSETIQELVVSTANEYLKDLTIKDILDIIANGQKPVECVPPESRVLL